VIALTLRDKVMGCQHHKRYMLGTLREYYTMGKLQLTRYSLGRVFHSICGRTYMLRSMCITAKWPSL
jgi:hypothetical protein